VTNVSLFAANGYLHVAQTHAPSSKSKVLKIIFISPHRTVFEHQVPVHAVGNWSKPPRF